MAVIETALPPPVIRRAIQPWMLVVGIILLGPFPMLIQLGRSLWEREQYQFFPLMIVGAAAVAWERWQDRPSRVLRRGSMAVAGASLAIGMLVLVGSALLWVRSAALVATLFMLVGIIWRIGGRGLLRTMGPSLVLLAVIVPLPNSTEQAVTLRLQHMAVTVSCRLLDVFRIVNVQAGNVIEIPGRRLLVEQACSGINSLMAVLAFTLLYGFYLRRSLGRIALLLPAAVLYVLGGNVVRITSEAIILVRLHVDVTEGTAHQLLGMVLFAVCVGLVASLDALLGGAEPASPAARIAGSAARDTGRATPPLTIGVPVWGVALAFLVMGAWLGARVRHAWAPPALAESATFELPETVAGWQQVKSGAMFVERPQTEAAKSEVFQFRRGDAFASVALDYPFTGYHELTICYSLSGWKVRSEVADPAAGFTRVVMDKPDGDGYLVFSQVDEGGRPVMSQGAYREGTYLDQWRTTFEIARRKAVSGPSYQMQTLLQSSAVPTVEQRQSAEALFREVRRLLTGQLLAQMGGAK